VGEGGFLDWLGTGQLLLANNSYEASTLEKISKVNKQKRGTQKRKWAKFTYIGKETRFLTSCLRIPTSKSHSPQTTLLKDAWQRNMGLTKISTARVAYTS